MARPAAKADSPPFLSPYRHGFVRVAACVPQIALADPAANAERTLGMVAKGHDQGVAVMVFPELGLSGYSIDDLHQQDALLDAVEAAIGRLAEASARLSPLFVVGAPLRGEGRLFNTAVVIQGGEVLGVVPKTWLPNYREYYERRWFASGLGVEDGEIAVAGRTAPFGVDLLFRAVGPTAFTLHAEICEDIWTPTPPSTRGALAGAEILLNLSASNIVIGKADARRLLCASQSMRCIAAYLYSAAGVGESTTDTAWDGQASIFELGEVLAESGRFPTDDDWALSDIDVGRIRQERRRTGSFGDVVAYEDAVGDFRIVEYDWAPPAGPLALARKVDRFPFVPDDPALLAEQCYEAYNIQVQGLAQRLKATGLKKLVIGVSGGLDSTQALIVACRTMDRLGLPRENVLAWTLPGFATSDRTYDNAWKLMKALGVTGAELDIRPAARQMLADLDHPFGRGEPVYDVTFENVQAGLRTDYLFRLANQRGALVVGTGDLSELALGWCTYGVGDHMSHYNPNASVAKTLIQHLIRFVAGTGDLGPAAGPVLADILATEISPELVPAGADGQGQSTESFVGPYALQDFNLYHLTRYGAAPSKIAYLAHCAWSDSARGDWPADLPAPERRAYDLAEIKKWLRLFITRFFANQFKRSAVPNGPKISSGGALSPRSDWRMPSDARADAWLAELDANTPDSTVSG
ncbi:NAD+ synthase (glutamine-hydrolyzing) [Caulobacter ginsengisoli]|uniref:Glutamine-dependent NAD(+) synthetase n=1 Tax=Caulobacter ginsengisoli TaxID=400775 RepID=A0ABU0IVZ0_9CAUL|nr:NAD(+) synthase [Caulobacter ginsengisoli]MDQ0466175.1 NAD+ synthase (glutamine-hydrolyzing) [Caulobacter ginsengisoli]